MRRIILVPILLSALLAGCFQGGTPRVMDIPATPPLSRSLGWAVVVPSYAQVYDSPGAGAVVLGYYRRAVVVPVAERRVERTKNEAVRWIRNGGTEPGWIKERDLQVFDTEAKAKTAAEEMK